MKLAKRLLITAALATLPALAFALPVTLDSPTAAFSGVIGGSSITFPTGSHDAEVRWGTPTGKFGTNQSGFGFDFFTAPLNTTTGSAFALGTFTHFNFEVKNGSAASGVDLSFSFDITDPAIGNVAFTFPFAIDETNNKPPCAETPVPATNYCPDIITFSSATSSQVFTIGGVKYTLDLMGFGPDAGHILNNFITQEGQENPTTLWARIDTASVPEPNAFLLMLLGLVALGGAVKLRRTHEDKA